MKRPIPHCEHFKNGPILDIGDLVGTWMTVYTQPSNITCFKMSIRATTDLERDQLSIKYGNFSGKVDFNQCLLQIETEHMKHFLQGDGGDSGLLENIVIYEDEKGQFFLQEQNADQWTMFGRRGGELLLMRDCSAEALAIFARAPYWPATTDIYAILHRSSIKATTAQRVMCQLNTDCYFNNGGVNINKQSF
ncbi:hypothetical protein O0L34_g13335 [Tuta absoluta]|nr:hypothetical protein O0L34_g13335 [Tuta absoluta]